MRRTSLVLAVFFVAFAIAWAGGDPWKTKPMSQWNDSDIDRALHNSPWSRVVPVEATWKPLTETEQNARMLPGTASGASGGSKGMGGTSTVLPAEHSDAQTRGACVRKQDISFHVLAVVDHDVDRIANLHRDFARGRLELLDGNYAFGFVSEVDDDVFSLDTKNRTLENLVGGGWREVAVVFEKVLVILGARWVHLPFVMVNAMVYGHYASADH